MTRLPIPAAPPGPPAADGATLDACRRGERGALDRVLRAEGAALARHIERLVGPTADVEDLLQVTFIEAIAAFPRFRGEASVRTWLLRIATNVVYEHFRRPERRRARVALELLPPADEPRDGAPSPERRAGDRQDLERLHRHLEAIRPKQRLAFLLHVVEGHPIDEVAALMGASATATKSRIFWARRTLLARLRRDPACRDLLPPAEGS